MSLPKVKWIYDDALNRAKLEKLELPEVREIGKNFLNEGFVDFTPGTNVYDIHWPKIRTLGDGFLSGMQRGVVPLPYEFLLENPDAYLKGIGRKPVQWVDKFRNEVVCIQLQCREANNYTGSSTTTQTLKTWLAIDSKIFCRSFDGFDSTDPNLMEKEYTYNEYMIGRSGCTITPKSPEQTRLANETRETLNIKKYSFSTLEEEEEEIGNTHQRENMYIQISILQRYLKDENILNNIIESIKKYFGNIAVLGPAKSYTDDLPYIWQKLRVDYDTDERKKKANEFKTNLCSLLGKGRTCTIYPKSNTRNAWTAVMVYKEGGGSSSDNRVTGRMMMSLKF